MSGTKREPTTLVRDIIGSLNPAGFSYLFPDVCNLVSVTGVGKFQALFDLVSVGGSSLLV